MSQSALFDNPLFWLLLGFFGGSLLTYFIMRRSFQHDRYLIHILVERAKWREALRHDIAQFCSLAYSLAEEMTANDERSLQLKEVSLEEKLARLDELRVRIRLRINPHELYGSDEFLVTLLARKAVLALRVREPQKVSRLLIRMERHAQRLLKEAWEASKQDVQTGRVRR